MVTAAVIGLALFAVLVAGVLALMAARRPAARVLVLACLLAVVGAVLAVVGDRVQASCLREADKLASRAGHYTIVGSPQDIAYQRALADCDTRHAFGVSDPF